WSSDVCSSDLLGGSATHVSSQGLIQQGTARGVQPSVEVIAIRRRRQRHFLFSGLFPPPPIGGFRVGFDRPRGRNFGELRCVHVPCLLEKVLFAAFGIGKFLALLICLRAPLSNYLGVVGADRALRECPPRGGQVVLEGFGQPHRFARGSPGRARLRSDPRVEVALPVECPLPARLGSGE